ncbi:PHA/PHB synthase family protein [Sneathiella litorea]|uniref:Alpha/beta fold hydrolase n=1 Tax=Sneathiella litorea TaxID=2606216 RepID=A0A6L8W8E7_9PROT|nr:alpha/beta fold hydrolase [Sneathiella litorea]MZR30754.1 alpha/beta fold hydrolase [Sneathiella litorea]
MKSKATDKVVKSPVRSIDTPTNLNKAPPPVSATAFSPATKPAVNIGPGFFERDSYMSTALPEILDRSVHALTAHFTLGLSPSSLASAYSDWALHLASAPGKQFQLIEKAATKAVRLATYSTHCGISHGDTAHCINPLPQDKRFTGAAWQQWPYNLMYQSFLMNQQWWHNATTGIRGVTKQHERVVEFAARQMLDIFSPSNFLATNPELLQKTMKESGQNLVRGAQNFVEDWERSVSGKKPSGTEDYKIGETLAVTPGKVIYSNQLIELIQYFPTTDKVHPEPIFIVPAWIMKYYILDLSSKNSFVKYLTEMGFTVFIISWKNPGPEERDLGMDDYRTLGITSALDAIGAITGAPRVHAIGYCLGGTLLSISAAALAREGNERYTTLTFLASQVDFKEAGELMLFINESEVTFLEDMMWEQGYLDTKQMAGAFQLLRSNDLIWSRLIHDYLMGERPAINDLMAWNADATRMPYKMHSEYLRHLFLNNDLAEGRYVVDGLPVTVSDIRVPIFAVGTEWDHVAPWRSVYKYNLLTDTDVTFLLTSGGHNAGIVSEPGRDNRHYRQATRKADDSYRDPDTWLNETDVQSGSWWPSLVEWLTEHSGDLTSPPPMGSNELPYKPLANAPGTYVLQE